MSDAEAFRKRMQGLEKLIEGVEQFKDPEARAHTREIVQAILDLHGAGLERILECAGNGGPAGIALIDALAEDDLIGSLLLLYGLHPLALETRVQRALERVRSQLRSHGGNVELLVIDEGVVHLRMQGSCKGRTSSALTLKNLIEDSIFEKAPDVLAIEVANTDEQAVEDGRSRVALPLLHG